MKERYDVAIVGGGPGGAILGTLLGRRGLDVLILERQRFPRFHIGESVTAFGAELFRDLGVYDELKELNYIKKKGLEFVLPDKSKKLYFPSKDANEPGELPWAFQMARSKMDDVLLRNARRNGVDVREGCAVQQVIFEGDRAVGVEYKRTGGADAADEGGPRSGRVLADWVVDASGQAGVLNRQLPDNCFNDHLHAKKIAIFAHFRGDFEFTNTDDDIHFKLCVHENKRDWAWFLPIEKDLVSIGVVLTKETVESRTGTLEELFFEASEKIAHVRDFLKQPGLEREGKLRSIADYSYRCRRYSGPGWALVGDSAGFIDPIFSTGLQITFNSAYKLADALTEALRDPARERAAFAQYDADLDRFFRVNSTLVHLFYTAKLDYELYEGAWYMWTNINFANWLYRLKYVWYGLKLVFVSEEDAKRMAEEVVFGNPQPGNKVAEMFLMLSKNFDKAYEKELRAETPRYELAEAEA